MNDPGSDLADPVADDRVVFAGMMADWVHGLVQAVAPDLAQFAALEPAEDQLAAVAAQKPRIQSVRQGRHQVQVGLRCAACLGRDDE